MKTVVGKFRAQDNLDMGGHHITDWRHLSDIPQGGAELGEALAWDGKQYSPAAVGAGTWDGLFGKPDTFPPSSHTHTVDTVEDSPAADTTVPWPNTTLEVDEIIVNANRVVNPDSPTDQTPVGVHFQKPGSGDIALGHGTMPDGTPGIVLTDQISIAPDGRAFASAVWLGGVAKIAYASGVLSLQVAETFTAFNMRVNGTFYADTIGASISTTTTVLNELVVVGDVLANNVAAKDRGIVKIGGSTADAELGFTLSTSVFDLNYPLQLDEIQPYNGSTVTITGDVDISGEFMTAGTNILINSATVSTTSAPTFTGTVIAGKFKSTAVVQATTNLYEATLVITTVGVDSNVYKTFASDMNFDAAASSFGLGSAVSYNANIDLNNSGGGFLGRDAQFFNGTMNQNFVTNTGEPFYMECTRPSTTQTYNEGFFSVDVHGGESGQTIAAYTRARVSGTADAIGYQGYAAGRASGCTGEFIGVQGFVVNNAFIAGACIVSMNGDHTGSSAAKNQTMGLRGKGHALIRGGSVFCVTDATLLAPAALSPTHVQANTNSGELYVEGLAEIDGELFMDGNETHSFTTVTVNYTAADKTNIYCDASGGAFTVTLTTGSGREYEVTKSDSSANAVTLGGTVNGVASPTIAFQYDSVRLQYNGTEWSIR